MGLVFMFFVIAGQGIIYFGSSLLMSFFTMPLMMPFAILSFSASFEQFDSRMMMIVLFGFMCLFFPLMIVFQSIMMTYMKSALFLSYMRLTTPKENAPVFIEANA